MGNAAGGATLDEDIAERKRAEIVSTRLAAIVESSDDAIISTDLDGIVTSWNRAAENIFGHTASEMVGTSLTRLIPADRLDEDNAILGKIQRGESVDHFETLRQNKDGRLIDVSVTVSPIKDAAGKLVGVSTLARDTTQRREASDALKASEETFRTAMEHSSSGMALVAPNGRWLKVNKALCDLVGYSQREMMRMYSQSIRHPEDRKGDTEYLRQISANEIQRVQCEQRFIHKDGRIIWVLLNVSLVRTALGAPRYFVAQIHDITARRQMDTLKSEFISTVSHELRTPLTSIRGALGLVAGGAVGLLPEKAAELVKIAHKNSERLARLVNDILDVERIESGMMQMHIDAVPIHSFLESALEVNHAYAENFGVRFVLDRSSVRGEVLADPARLMQVVTNLLSNAAKFSRSGSDVILRARRVDHKIRFEVQDHGRGIPEAFGLRVFQKFSQADASSTRSREGTGLGLSIAKQLVEAMEGSIGFHSEMGEGSTFYFDLPEATLEPKTLAPPQAAVAEFMRRRILVCESNADSAALVAKLVERADFKADVASTTVEARRLLGERHYVAATLNLPLSVADGGAFLRELHTNPATSSMPVVVVSARLDEIAVTTAGDAKDVAYWLMKPVDQTRLVDSLRWAVERTQKNVLCVTRAEDDVDLSDALAAALQDKARIVCAPALSKAEQELRARHFDLLVLDLDRPDGSGRELLQRLNEVTGYSVPVLLISASETPREVQQQVAASLNTSRVSQAKIIDTVLVLLQVPPISQKESANGR